MGVPESILEERRAMKAGYTAVANLRRQRAEQGRPVSRKLQNFRPALDAQRKELEGLRKVGDMINDAGTGVRGADRPIPDKIANPMRNDPKLEAAVEAQLMEESGINLTEFSILESVGRIARSESPKAEFNKKLDKMIEEDRYG